MDAIQEIAQAVLELEEDKAETLVRAALANGLDPVKVLQEGVIAGIKAIGEKFETQEYFLLELMMGGDIGKKLIAIITPHLPAVERTSAAKVVIGSSKGDIHDIGKNLVITQLQIAGFEVYDLGVDVPSMAFIDKAREVDADIIGMSAFLSNTMACFAEVVNYLKDMGLRDKFKVIAGGGPTSPEYVESIGADGWAPNGFETVKLCERLLAK